MEGDSNRGPSNDNEFLVKPVRFFSQALAQV